MSTPTYDPTNIFAKILRGEIPCQKIYENEHVLAFPDLHPQAPIHVLLIPKGAYTDVADFGRRASAVEAAAFFAAIPAVAAAAGLEPGGFRIIANNGANAHQEVPHFHLHLLGGRKLGAMLVKG
ncbi:MAG: HIT domain-containing protein [Candidatus Symbiobacter sp.]|nr:HIT domain-containing protein [Candidatus Symbiobacter sp.]